MRNAELDASRNVGFRKTLTHRKPPAFSIPHSAFRIPNFTLVFPFFAAQNVVVVLREAVRLVADVLQKAQAPGVARKV